MAALLCGAGSLFRLEVTTLLDITAEFCNNSEGSLGGWALMEIWNKPRIGFEIGTRPGRED